MRSFYATHVTCLVGEGRYSRRWGYPLKRRYVFEDAEIRETPLFFNIKGKAKIYKGYKSNILVSEEEVVLMTKKHNVTFEAVPNSVKYFKEEAK